MPESFSVLELYKKSCEYLKVRELNAINLIPSGFSGSSTN